MNTNPLDSHPSVISRLPARSWWKSKTVMGLLAINCILIAWALATWQIHELPPEKLVTFQAITLYCMSGFTMILCWTIGMNNIDKIFSLKTEAASMANAIATTAINKTDITQKTEIIEHVIDEGSPGAPSRRPFNPDDTHESMEGVK